MGTKKKTIHCDIGADEHRAARHRSFDTGQTLGEVITEALREHLVGPNRSTPEGPPRGGPPVRPAPVTPAPRRKEGGHEDEAGSSNGDLDLGDAPRRPTPHDECPSLNDRGERS